MCYSPCFQTLHDETRPVGRLGRGTHYSVLRVPIWQDQWLKPLSQGLLLDFAIIWDEDHDERVMELVEALYFDALLAPVRFIGERKGSLSVLIDTKTVEAWDETALCNYREVVSAISQALEDPWPATVDVVTGRDHSIIHAPSDDVTTYLKHIDLLWQLGAKARTPRREESKAATSCDAFRKEA